MALNKKINNDFGIPCEYWVLGKIEKSKISKTAFLILYGYPSKEIRENTSCTFMDRRFFNIYPDKYDEVFDIALLSENGVNDTANVYKYVKENLEEFKDAIDI